jgi:hypothetical protein
MLLLSLIKGRLQRDPKETVMCKPGSHLHRKIKVSRILYTCFVCAKKQTLAIVYSCMPFQGFMTVIFMRARIRYIYTVQEFQPRVHLPHALALN